MSILNRRHFSDLRGMVRLAVDATVGVTDLVEKMHHTGHLDLLGSAEVYKKLHDWLR